MTTDTTETTAEIFAKVAPFLGADWQAEAVDPENRTMGGYLVRSDGARLHAYGGYQAGRTDRLAISGQFPREYAGRPERITITVAKNRDPKAIAAEITRRLLPEYLPELERVREAVAAAEVAADKQAAAIARLCDIFPLAGPQSNGVRWYDNGDAVSYGEVSLWNDGAKGELKISSVSFDTLARLFGVLAEVREEELAAADAEINARAHSED